MSASRRVLCFGGNGHASVRFEAARRVLRDEGRDVVLAEAAYPGFEGRPRVPRDRFLESVLETVVDGGPWDLLHASGIGALIALSVRARGAALDAPLVLQGPVLWGLENRRFPRLMRAPGAARALQVLLRIPLVQRRFVRRHFRRRPDASFVRAFFDGYARCPAFGDLFHLFTPAFLRRLETDLASQPAALEDVVVWVGGHDEVVGRAEVEATERALGVRLPLRVLGAWGHYPMIDDPEGWVAEVCDALAIAQRAA